ncbi:MAG: aminoacyl-tRNA hydrolase [Clostridia bacterium]|nr:aminoacyl-tRNA hydrolase [Clostridia bacterium]
MHIICGLGNPGKEYESTRHNMGFLTMDVLSSRLGIPIKKIKYRALIGEGFVGGEKIVLVKPQTFMNLSGEAVRPIMDYFNANLSDLIVVYDDIDLAVGDLRIRKKGSAGTHNGMKSVIYMLGRDDFPRVRIGIGEHGMIPIEKYVLGKYTEKERPLLADAVLNAAQACEVFVREGIDESIRLFSRSSSNKKSKGKCIKEEEE